MRLSKGSRIQAKLIEEVDANHWIVSFKGHLLQVKNSTSIKFESEMSLELEVVKEKPLELKILSPSCKIKKRLDVHV